MDEFDKYLNKIENQSLKEFTKYLDEGEFGMLKSHFLRFSKEQLKLYSVMQAKPEKVCECKCEHPIIRQGIKEYCSVCGLDIK